MKTIQPNYTLRTDSIVIAFTLLLTALVQARPAGIYIVGAFGYEVYQHQGDFRVFYGGFQQPIRVAFVTPGKVYIHRGDNYKEFIIGTDGADTIFGGPLGDIIVGGNGNDTINGLRGDDRIQGNRGNDWIYGAKGNDTIRGGKGDDHLFGERGTDQLYGDIGRDHVDGGFHNRDWLHGGPGSDTLTDRFGSQTYADGGEGTDICSIQAADRIVNCEIRQ